VTLPSARLHQEQIVAHAEQEELYFCFVHNVVHFVEGAAVVWVCLLDASVISASSSTVLKAAVLTAVLLYVGIVGCALLRRLVLRELQLQCCRTRDW
jgi:hypothetical protein